VSLSCTVSEI